MAMLVKAVRRWLNKRRVKNAISLLMGLDFLMKKADISRQQRRYFWRSMVDQEERQKAVDWLSKSIKYE